MNTDPEYKAQLKELSDARDERDARAAARTAARDEAAARWLTDVQAGHVLPPFSVWWANEKRRDRRAA